MAAPRFHIRSIELFERAVRFTRPFRFGSVTVEGAPQVFVRTEIETTTGSIASGASAELMVPRWFDKRPHKTICGTITDLRRSISHAAGLYRALDEPLTAFGTHAAIYPEQRRWAKESDLPLLAAAFGPAVIDKAVVDALFRAKNVGFIDGMRANVVGLTPALTPDLNQTAIDSFLVQITAAPSVIARHTIGMLDSLEGPGGLVDEIARNGLRSFKIKLGGNVAEDVDRLRSLFAILGSSIPDFQLTLDANEQYDVERLQALMQAMGPGRDLHELSRRLLYIEQPLDRSHTFTTHLGSLGEQVSFIIDEADDDYGAFPHAAQLGYRGVSSKACKGLYKSFLNATRAASWNRGRAETGHFFFITGEDLTCQAGLAVQQDTVIVAALGLSHVERNGHHYVDGFGTAPAIEANGFAKAHPSLYRMEGDRPVLDIRGGALSTKSLFAPGFASGAEPDWSSLSPLTEPAHQEKIV